MDTTNSITFTSKLTFWDKFKCFYLLHLCSLIFLIRFQKKWEKILIYLCYTSVCGFSLAILVVSYPFVTIKMFIDVFLTLSCFSWVPAITAFLISLKCPSIINLKLSPDNNLGRAPIVKIGDSNSQIVYLKSSLLLDTKNFYLIMCPNYLPKHKSRVFYSFISKSQNTTALSKVNFIASVKPHFKKFIKLHIWC